MNENKDLEMPELDDGILPEGAPVMSEEEEAALKKKNKKKKMIAGVAIFAAVGIISGVFLALEPLAKNVFEGSLGMYGSDKSYSNYTPDYNLDVTSVPEYMELDRNIYFKKGGEKFIVEESDENSADLKFFLKYFDLAINGKYNEYNDLFTENYYKTNEPYVRFAPQMIYDITIEKLSERYQNGGTSYTYNVTYRIYKNNGTFRNDIGSDGAKTLFFSLVEENGELKIDRITYYV